MTEPNLVNSYYWLLECANGRISQVENNRRPPQQRIDPQRPPESLGRPLLISLVPKSSEMPSFCEEIPEGCLPVCAIQYDVEVFSRSVAAPLYRIGHNRNGHRTMKSINMITLEVVTLEDDKGCKIQVVGTDDGR